MTTTPWEADDKMGVCDTTINLCPSDGDDLSIRVVLMMEKKNYVDDEVNIPTATYYNKKKDEALLIVFKDGLPRHPDGKYMNFATAEKYGWISKEKVVGISTTATS